MTEAYALNVSKEVQKAILNLNQQHEGPKKETEVLFQRFGNKWFAFSESGDVYFLEKKVK